MELLTVRELYKNTAAYAGKTVEFGGWVRNLRASKAFGFVMLSDGTYFQPVQVVYNDQMANFTEISKTNIGANQSIHWLRIFHVFFGVNNGFHLVYGFSVFKIFFHFILPTCVCFKFYAFSYFSFCI